VPVYREISCRSLLSRSGIADVDYSINPYVGCEHGCAYCYARFMGYRSGHSEDWGEWVDIKVNAPPTLASDLTRSSRGTILLSSVTDPYQPLEEKYQLTRRILIHLLEYDYPISILTKSALIYRDIDLLEQFERCQVGATVTVWREEIRRAFEPHSSSPIERFNTLRRLRDKGIQTYLFLGPILPGFTEEDLDRILDECERADIGQIIIDRLKIKYGNWSTIGRVLDKRFPERKDEWRRVLFDREGYFQRIKNRIIDETRERGIPLISCY